VLRGTAQRKHRPRRDLHEMKARLLAAKGTRMAVRTALTFRGSPSNQLSRLPRTPARWQCHDSRRRAPSLCPRGPYIGKLLWNKLRHVKDPDTRQRRSKANKAEAVIEKDVPHLLVIEQDLWNAVKQRQAEVMLGPHNTATRPWDRLQMQSPQFQQDRQHRP
jgi:hypothetical protein